MDNLLANLASLLGKAAEPQNSPATVLVGDNLKSLLSNSLILVGHDRIDLVLQEDKVAHHDVHAAVAFRHCEPPSETEGRRSRGAIDRDLQIVAGNVDL